MLLFLEEEATQYLRASGAGEPS